MVSPHCPAPERPTYKTVALPMIRRAQRALPVRDNRARGPPSPTLDTLPSVNKVLQRCYNYIMAINTTTEGNTMRIRDLSAGQYQDACYDVEVAHNLGWHDDQSREGCVLCDMRHAHRANAPKAFEIAEVYA